MNDNIRAQSTEHRTQMERYNCIFKNIWEKTVPFLGEITTEGIFRRLIKKREIQYPFLSKIALSEKGFDLSLINRTQNTEHRTQKEEEKIREGLNLIIDDFYKFLKEMTGELIVSEIKEVVKNGGY